MDRAQKKSKMVVRNWECGIVCSADRLGFGLNSWGILKRFMIVDGVNQVAEPWIFQENGGGVV